MTGKDSEEAFVQKVRQVLDTDVENLGGGTRSQLGRIRREALDAPGPRQWGHGRIGRRWLAGATAAAAVAGLIYFNAGPAPDDRVARKTVEAFDIMALEETLEFIDDIEFYAWLAEVDDGNV
jgi:hypothetical protein